MKNSYYLKSMHLNVRDLTIEAISKLIVKVVDKYSDNKISVQLLDVGIGAIKTNIGVITSIWTHRDNEVIGVSTEKEIDCSLDNIETNGLLELLEDLEDVNLSEEKESLSLGPLVEGFANEEIELIIESLQDDGYEYEGALQDLKDATIKRKLHKSTNKNVADDLILYTITYSNNKQDVYHIINGEATYVQ